jgi:putative ubiquitin-RnfH superfamily antitoxin RatB of RatAB toxin-antitoxin module
MALGSDAPGSAYSPELLDEGGGDVEVEVAYAKADVQAVLPVTLPAGATVRALIEASGILDVFPEISLETQRVGVFGTLVDLDFQPASGERVEIYRPLVIDPKERRRERAQETREAQLSQRARSNAKSNG